MNPKGLSRVSAAGKSINKSLFSWKEKSEESYIKLLFDECKKDNRSIDYNTCYELLKKCTGYDLMNEIDPYTGESILHLWCFHGHYDLVEELLTKEPDMVSIKDQSDNTCFHALCQNTVSSENELIAMFQYLNQFRVKIGTKNVEKLSGIDILIQRIREKNPYDGNLTGIRFLYWNVLDTVSAKHLQTIK